MDLAERLKHLIASEGPIPFARFMETALYDEVDGYYSSGRVRIGQGGDFVTAPHLSEAFAGCLASLAAAADAALDNPKVFSLIEGGPGEGRLAAALLDALAEKHPGLYRRLSYTPIEKSPALASRQRHALARHAEKVTAHPKPDAIGLYLSNELVDALPVHIIETRAGELTEIAVSERDGVLCETGIPLREGEIRTLAREVVENRALAELTAEGAAFRFEVCPGLAPWLREASDMLKAGYLLTIDYGDIEERLYGPGKPGGTVRGYRDNGFVENLLAEPGACDLTASVNFSGLYRRAAELQLSATRLMKQWELLYSLGLPEVVETLEAKAADETDRLAVRQELWPLLFPGAGMGESFKSVILAKGVELSALGLVF